MEYTLNEKIAFLHALIEMMTADGVVSQKEMELINKIVSLREMNVGQTEFNKARLMSYDEARNILSKMTDDKKEALGCLLRTMAHADGVVDDGEKIFWMRIKSDVNITNIKEL